MTRRRPENLWEWQRRQPSQTPLRDALHKAVGTGLAAVMFVAALWVAPYVRTAWPHQRPAEQATADATAARASEDLLERVELETARAGGVAASPGVRPPFVPSQALVVRDGLVRLVPLGRVVPAGVVAWVP